LKAVENAHTDREQEQTMPVATSGGFDYLLEYTQDRLAKEFTKSAYNDVLFKLMSGETCQIEEASILVIKTNEAAFTVRFLSGASLAESVCSCKIKNCRHRLEAIMQYIKYKTGKLDFQIITQDSDLDLDIIPKLSTFIEDIFRTGLFRLPAEYGEKCMQFAVLCHGAGFVVFERLFEACGYELSLYIQKSASFNKNTLLRNLTRIYQMCNEIQSGGIEKAAALAGKFKRQYMEMPKLHIIGLGAYPWYAKSGFCGVTAVFYAPDLKQSLNFSLSRPVGSETEAATGIEQIWHSNSAWNLSLSLGAISKGDLSLQGAKISENGRLSSSENTSATLIKSQTVLSAISSELESANSSATVNDFSNIKNLISGDPDDTQTVYAVLKIRGIDKGSYDRITQTYRTQLFDGFENTLTLTIKYSKINEIEILNFEHLAHNKIIPDAVTVSIAIYDDSFGATVTPVAIWMNGEIINIGVEKLFSNDKKSEYAKFFKDEEKK
jgi:hypothetical protein